ncbi:unnamed protein product [Lupinus luteus]|uniref:S-protein homolog n=1 Tax=Lupinus luteus TaxID=3873 RepID=A0AAV1X6W4_LUPLU
MNKIVLSSFTLATIFVTLQMMVGVEALDIGFAKDVRITMFNNISQTIAINCKEKNYDDGFHDVNPGESYSFTITVSRIVPRSLWYCSFSWGNGGLKTFDIYLQKRDGKCGMGKTACVWSIREGGPCRVGGQCYPWNN